MEDKKTVEMLKRIRHDFGNHLQVISGFIELGRPEEGKEYILRMVEEMAAEKILFESVNADAALYFYNQMLLAKDLGVIIRYKDIKLDSIEYLLKANEPYTSLELVVSKIRAKDDEPVVNISFYQKKDGIHMVFESAMIKESFVVNIIKE